MLPSCASRAAGTNLHDKPNRSELETRRLRKLCGVPAHRVPGVPLRPQDPPEYFICYLSSQSGCNRGCTFCHLTATGQTLFEDATRADFTDQAVVVFRHHKNQDPAKYVHFNFMARGEPLANKHLLARGDEILWALGERARDRGLGAKFNISTIMPTSFKGTLEETFRVIHPTIYYSLYSMKDSFRSKWMPGAAPVHDALSKLRSYQAFSKKMVKIHFPFIRGENDGLDDMKLMCDAIDAYNLDVEFNLVRYNPASLAQGEESDAETIERNISYLGFRIGLGRVKVIPRVGFDVSASCGMFHSADN